MLSILKAIARNKFTRSLIISLMKKYSAFSASVQEFYVRSQLGHAGENLRLGRKIIVEHPENIYTGKNVLIHHCAYIYAYSKVTLEDGVYIGKGASLITPSHDFTKTGEKLERNVVSKPITICKDAVINSESIILGGVTVGEGAIVAAKSLVTSDVKPYTYVIGVPARSFFKRTVSE